MKMMCCFSFTWARTTGKPVPGQPFWGGDGMARDFAIKFYNSSATGRGLYMVWQKGWGGIDGYAREKRAESGRN